MSTFLSAASANALISDLRPTTLSTPALEHINALIDEVLSLLVAHSESINPTHIRVRGVPAVFSGDKSAGETTGPRALGRSAVAEAELELRSWYDSHPGGKRGAFGPDGQSTGIRALATPPSASFPIREATELLKLRCVSFSTLAPSSPPTDVYEEQIITAWKLAGGDTSEETLSPAGLWMTAILEHICEHVLGQLARVVARDSSIAVAGVQDLYVSLCEDENIWGLFKRLQVKSSLELAIKNSTRQRRVTPQRHTPSHSFGGISNTTNSSKTSLPPSASAQDTSLEHARLAASTPVEHIPHSQSQDRPSRGPVANLARKVSASTTQSGQHQRSASLLSANTKSIVSAFNEQHDQEHAHRASQDEDEFDALVRSGETMKVSLTPSRLKTFEVSPNRRSPASPTQSQYVRTHRPTQSPDLPSDLSPLTPSNAYSSNDSPRKGSNLRPSSGARLVARNAAIIREDKEDDEEQMNEDDIEGSPAGARPKKESLAEMFAAEAKHGSRKSSASSTKKRTVPAVVLGSPPPRESSLPSAQTTSPPGTTRRTKRNDLTVETTDNDDLFRPRKPRSEAQELADFFNTTQPPGGITRPLDNAADQDFGARATDEPPKSAKSFKSFMSRMTGGKKKDGAAGQGGKDSDRPPMPSSYSSGGLSGLVRRQKSSASFASSAALPASGNGNGNSNDNAGNEKLSQTAPPYPGTLSAVGRMARQPSNEPMTADQMAAIGVAALGMGSGLTSEVTAPEKRMNVYGLHVNTHSRQSTSSVADIEGEHGHRGLVPEPSRPADSPTIGQTESSMPTPKPITLGAPLEPASDSLARSPPNEPAREGSTDEFVVVDKADVVAASGSLEPDVPATTPSPTKPTPSTATHSQFPSEAASFTTANEGEGSGAEEDGASAEDEDHRRHTITGLPAAQPAAALGPAPAPGPPSIPLADLVPLRGLLQHATTARECQLLLGAILSQLGVPLSDPSGSTTIDPESRVTAWLLAGREGPGDYQPSWSAKSQAPTTTTTTTTTTAMTTTAETDDTIATPTMTQSELRATSESGQGEEEHLVSDAEHDLGAVGVSKEDERRSSGSETTSMARTSISAVDSVPEVKEAKKGQWAEAEAVHLPQTSSTVGQGANRG